VSDIHIGSTEVMGLRENLYSSAGGGQVRDVRHLKRLRYLW